MNLLDIMYADQARRLHRSNDPETSREAAKLVAPHLNALQKQVLDYAVSKGEVGFTDLDLNRHFDCTGSTYRTRRAELVDRGLIKRSGCRLRIGKRAYVIWEITEKDRAEAAS